MPLIDLPHPPTVHNAPANAAAIAMHMLRDAVNIRFNGRVKVDGGRCMMCGRKPPSDELIEIVLDSSQDSRVQIGIGRCYSHHLGTAVRRLLAIEGEGNIRTSQLAAEFAR